MPHNSTHNELFNIIHNNILCCSDFIPITYNISTQSAICNRSTNQESSSRCLLSRELNHHPETSSFLSQARSLIRAASICNPEIRLPVDPVSIDRSVDRNGALYRRSRFTCEMYFQLRHIPC